MENDIPGASAPRQDAIRVHLGIDFGTSFTKVCYRIRGRGFNLARIAPLTVCGSSQGIIPSVVFEDGESRLWTALSERGRTGTVTHRYLKMKLAGMWDGKEESAERSVEALAAFYIAEVIRHARVAIEQSESTLLSGRNVRWSAKICVPIGERDQRLMDLFGTMYARAWELATMEEEPFYPALAERYRAIVANPESPCQGFPEIGAAVHSFLLTRDAIPGLYCYLDIGGGTLDCSAFHLAKGSDGASHIYVYSTKVSELGLESICRKSGMSEEEILRVGLPSLFGEAGTKVAGGVDSFMSDIQTLVAQTLHDMRAKAKIEGPWKLHEGRYSLQMGGGGARSPWYLRTIDETRERWPAEDSLRQSFDAIEVPVSTDLEISPRNGGNGFRFSVAFGLTAPFGEETPIQGFPWQFSASTPDVGIAESHSSENEESGHPCTCSGNPDCPKCGGFGFVGGFAPTGDGTEFPIQARKPLRASQRLAEGEKLFLLPLALIGPNPEQPRKSFSDESLDELANSILIHGVIQPIVVEAMSNLRSTIHAPGRMRSEAVAREIAAGEIAAEDSESIASPVFRIIAGERRYRAALRAGLDEIPAIIRKIPSERRVEISLIENIQREDLNPVDEAEAFRALMDLTGKTQDEVAETVGKSRSFVANALRLLKLAPRMLAALRAATITAGHSRALLVLSDASARDTLFDRILDESLSVREAEESARKMAVAISCGGNEAAPARPARAARRKASTPGKDESRDPLLAVREESLIRNLGSKVSIRGSADRGILELEYGSAEELNRIVEAIGSLTRG